MSSISPINFRGGGSESSGSIAYRNNKPEIPVNETKVNFRGGGTETTGSIAHTDKPTLATPISADTVNFQGSGTETTGSIAHTTPPTECPNCGNKINFKGTYENDKKGMSTIGVIGSLVALTAATIIGLGYAHKKGSFKNLKEGWMKTAGEKIEPVAAKCHEWCTSTKKVGLEWWNKIKNIGNSKKD